MDSNEIAENERLISEKLEILAVLTELIDLNKCYCDDCCDGDKCDHHLGQELLDRIFIN